jgi:hypothetical protein
VAGHVAAFCRVVIEMFASDDLTDPSCQLQKGSKCS